MRRAAALLVALLALAWQSLAVQPHVHLPGGPEAAVPHASPLQLRGERSPADDPAHCVLCRQLGLGGSYIAGTSPAFAPRPAPAVAAPPLPAAGAAVSRRSHGWRSRGPPPPAAHP